MVPGTQRRLQTKKRETLQKKTPAPPASSNHSVEILAAPDYAKPSAAELEVESPVDTGIPDCAELPTNPPTSIQPPPITPSTWIKQRSASLPGCPEFLVPGSGYIDRQIQPWRDVTHAATSAEQVVESPTSASRLESTLADWQQLAAMSPASSLPSPSSCSSAERRGSASTLSPFTPPTPASSRTSPPCTTPDGLANLSPLSEGVAAANPKALLRDQYRPSLIQLAPQPQRPRLSVRQSSSNIEQLLARHALLESRRQILLQLHEVEKEQERIVEELGAMPEEHTNYSELSG